MSHIKIKKIDSHFESVVSVIRESYLTVAEEFKITKENGSSNPAFIELEHLHEMNKKGIEMYGAFVDSSCIGFVALENAENGLYYLEKLAVLPSQRHHGYGLQLIDFVFNRVKRLGGKEISIGIINENTILKEWYLDYGFKEIEIKRFEHLPFTVCLLRKNV
ncbi:MAG: GNAT family N-acetyltransferase [Spirochaetaceae bacterium]|nr:GNAT family N-acetyltransferase [Spirochaetaceae bacterium]